MDLCFHQRTYFMNSTSIFLCLNSASLVRCLQGASSPCSNAFRLKRPQHANRLASRGTRAQPPHPVTGSSLKMCSSRSTHRSERLASPSTMVRYWPVLVLCAHCLHVALAPPVEPCPVDGTTAKDCTGEERVASTLARALCICAQSDLAYVIFSEHCRCF